MDIKIDTLIPGSRFFFWREALYLPRLNDYHNPTDLEAENIKNLAIKLDQVRAFMGLPFKINVWIRPTNFTSKKYPNKIDYNALVGGAKGSAHIVGSAVDGSFFGMDVDSAIEKIIPKLSELKLSMEQNGTKFNRPWVHFQDKPMNDGKYRVFLP